MTGLRNFLIILILLWTSATGVAFLKGKAASKNKCQRYHALKRFSSCGTVVGHAVREKSLLENPNHNATCQKAQGFEQCFQESMRSTHCTRNSEFSFHLQHISSLVHEMYKESCSPSGETSNVLTDMSAVCDIRVAVVRFLECASSFYIGEQGVVGHDPTEAATTLGVHFGVIFDAPSVGGAIDKYNRIANVDCRRSIKLRNCIDNIHLYSECGIGTEVHSHLRYLTGVVHRKFVGKCSSQSQMPELDCQLLPFLRKFLRCGVNRYESAGDRVDEDNCAQVLSYKDCVVAAERVTHCNMRNLSLSFHLEYLHKVMTAVNSSCKGIRNIETSVYKESCKRTTLFNNYFSCGMGVQAHLEGLQKGDKERCRISENFEKCFVSAKEQSGCLLADEATSIMSALLDTWKKEHAKECAVYNMPVMTSAQSECLTGPAVRKVFLCGLNFQTAVREVKYSPKEISPEVCRHLDDLNNCVSEVKTRTQCALSELHAHIAPLLQPFTIDYSERCDKLVASNQSAWSVVSAANACRRLPTLKRIFHCGLSFSKILEEMELVRQKAEVLCPLLKKYETCVPDSATEQGCRDDPVMKGHVRSFGKILHRQYYDACIRNRRVGLMRSNGVRNSRGNHSNEILGSVKVLRQELRKVANVSTNSQKQVSSGQVMEDYYGSDYDDYIEEDDKVPDSLDDKPSYDYTDRDASPKPKKPSPFKLVEDLHEGLHRNFSYKEQGHDTPAGPKRSQEFWTGVERARKLRSRRKYDPNSFESLRDLSSKRVDRDFARPGTYFVDQLSNPSGVQKNDPYARKHHSGDVMSASRVKQQYNGNVQNSPNSPQYSPASRSIPHTARQGEGGADEYYLRNGPERTREEELEMYEDTRGMSELLQKENQRGYGRYRVRDALGSKHDTQPAGYDSLRRYPTDSESGMVVGDQGLPRSAFNKSYAYYDYHGVPNVRAHRDEQVLYRGQRSGDGDNYNTGGRMMNAPLYMGRLRTLQGRRHWSGVPRGGRAFRNLDYELVAREYLKPGGHQRRPGEAEEEEKDIVSFPDDDGPVLPNDEILGQDIRHRGHRGPVAVRRRDDANFVGSASELELQNGVLDPANIRRGRVLKEGNINTIPIEKDQPARNEVPDGGVQYYPRQLTQNKMRGALGSPMVPLLSPGIRREEYEPGSREYNSVHMKVDSDPNPGDVGDGENTPRFAAKYIEKKERLAMQTNPRYHLSGGDLPKMRSIQRNPSMKRSPYKDIGKREQNNGIDAYPEQLRPYPNLSHRRSNDSNYAVPNHVLPEPGMRSPKEKVLPDFLENSARGDSRSRKEESLRDHPMDAETMRDNYARESDLEEEEIGSATGFAQQNPERFFDIKKRWREPRLGFPYVQNIDEAPGLLLEKKDEASGSGISFPQPRGVSLLQPNQYEIERKRKNKLLKDDLEELLSKHKEESDTKDDLMLFPDEHPAREDKLVKDFDAKSLEDSKDYSELDVNLENEGSDMGSMWSGVSDEQREELIKKHIQIPEKKTDPVIGQLGKRNAWYSDDIWNDKNDLFGMERLLSDQQKDVSGNVTADEDNSQCQIQYLERRSDACSRIFDDDFRAMGNGSIRQFSPRLMTPALRKSACSHARDFAQCINLFAQKFRCLDRQDLINNLTDDHLRKAGVMFCASSTVSSSAWVVLAALFLHANQRPVQ